MEALHATGKPVIVILINGRPLTINWAAKYAPAILEAWFPSASGGKAIAETIFGDYNPGGKLSVTFPKSIGQLELSFPYKPGSHANQPSTGDNGFGKTRVNGVLYPFGHGLSYTTFQYSNLQVTPKKQNIKGQVEVAVDITNSGKVKGEEVVQLYFKDKLSSVIVYDTQLRGFERISLLPGEKKTVQFIIKPEHLELLNRQMQPEVEPGEFEVLIGSSSEDIRLKEIFLMEK